MVALSDYLEEESMSYLTANMKMIAECADKLAHLGEKLLNMTEMKYRAGNKVRIKSLDWYNENKGMNGLVGLFTPSMKKLCGMVVTLDSAYNGKYTAIEKEAKGYYLDDSMIEGLADDLTEVEGITLDEEFATEWANFDFSNSMNDIIRKRIEENMSRIEQTLEGAMLYTGVVCPEGYEFRDENGNVINATKIVLEKKKKEYPKTYEECCVALEYIPHTDDIIGYKWDILQSLQKLLICRDAYWKLYADEKNMPWNWKPDYDSGVDKFGIVCYYNEIQRTNAVTNLERHKNKVLEFPTEEMRDTFYENFKVEIESCKELL